MTSKSTTTVESKPPAKTGDELMFSMRLGFLLRQRTYRQIADATGISSTSVRRMVLNGRPSSRLLIGLCQSFGVSPEWLLLGKGPVYAFHPQRPRDPPPLSQPPSSDDLPTTELIPNRRAYRAQLLGPVDRTTASPS